MSDLQQCLVPPEGLPETAYRAPPTRYHQQRQFSFDGSSSTAADDWSRAAKEEQLTISQPAGVASDCTPEDMRALPEVENPQNWQNMVAAADHAYSVRQSYDKGAADHVVRPTASVSVIKEVTVETQPAFVEAQRPASFVPLRQPSVTVEVTGPRTPALQSSALGGRSVDGVSFEADHDVVVRKNTSSNQSTRLGRKASFKESMRRAGSKVSNAVVTALRSSAKEPPMESKSDIIMAEWKSFNSARQQEEMALGGAFNSLQDMIEQAMNLKYRSLRGEGNSLIDAETVELTTKEPAQSLSEPLVESPLEKEQPTTANSEEKIWMTYTETEDHVSGLHDLHIGSTKKACLPSGAQNTGALDLECRPPQSQTYSQHAAYIDPQPESSRRTLSTQANAVQPVETDKSQTLPKSRQDSAHLMGFAYSQN